MLWFLGVMEKSFHPNTRDFVLARLSSEEKLLSISNVRIFPSRRMICVYAEWTTVKNTPLPLMLLLFVNPKYESSPPPPFYVLLKALVCAYIEERHEPLIRGEGREEDGQTFNCKKSPACLKGRTTTSTTSSKRGRETERERPISSCKLPWRERVIAAHTHANGRQCHDYLLIFM